MKLAKTNDKQTPQQQEKKKMFKLASVANLKQYVNTKLQENVKYFEKFFFKFVISSKKIS